MLTYVVLAVCVLTVFASDNYEDRDNGGGYGDRGYDDRSHERPSLSDTAKDGKCVPQKPCEQLCNFEAHDCFVYGDMCKWEIKEEDKKKDDKDLNKDKKDDLLKNLDKKDDLLKKDDLGKNDLLKKDDLKKKSTTTSKTPSKFDGNPSSDKSPPSVNETAKFARNPKSDKLPPGIFLRNKDVEEEKKKKKEELGGNEMKKAGPGGALPEAKKGPGGGASELPKSMAPDSLKKTTLGDKKEGEEKTVPKPGGAKEPEAKEPEIQGPNQDVPPPETRRRRRMLQEEKALEQELAAAVPVAPSQCAPTENITLYALAFVGVCSIASKTFFGLRGLTHSHIVVTEYEPMMEDF